MKTIIPSLLALVLFSCSVNQKIARKLRRADKLEKKAIALGAVIKIDTLWKIKTIKGDSTTVIIPGLSTHTTDTIHQNHVKIIYRLRRDTLTITAVCDTVKIKVPYIVNKEVICPPVDNKWKWIALTLGGLLLAIVGLLVLRR